ncbi:EAL domain-containing protein [Shinella sp. PSBB067]|uniref:EAL domain-containing protein n=1 Tax=Shinella sp. PSBB067 TaxID=2715959 RepID=UPI00193B7FAE|nr:EAL domain-containing protein [Shinella sp. PSBB067]QRI63766.1 EAL domain-containing protein [Shinella sp. PSBB067]
MMAPLKCAVVIDNLCSIAAAYSDGVAGRVLDAVWARLECALEPQGLSIQTESFGVVVSSGEVSSATAFWSVLESAVYAVAVSPIIVGSSQIVVALRCATEDCVYGSQEPAGEASRYRLDMSVAALAYNAVEAGSIAFVEQPVVAADARNSLYRECLVRLAGDDGHAIMPGAYLPVLERLGLVRAFDRHIVFRILQRLRWQRDAVLGCNISALSATNDLWWNSIMAELVLEPELASRLVIEITETAPLPDLDQAVHFISSLRALGVRVALDDFGAGFSTIDFARRAKADVIKIDASYIRRSHDGESAAQLLESLVAFAHNLVSDLVVEGIESAADFTAARATGANWFQGFFFRAIEPPVMAPIVPRLASRMSESESALQ